MFSSRTDWDFRPFPLFSLAEQKRIDGETMFDLTESNPTRCGFRYSPHDLIDEDALLRSVEYEPDPKGILSARQSIARWYQDKHRTIDPEQIILTSGTSEAYSFLFRLLCNAGESVAVPAPSYPLFDYLCQLNDVRQSQYRLNYDGEWHLDVKRAETDLPLDTKAFVLIHPNNPTGSFVKKDERQGVLSFAARRRIPVIVDEVFLPYAFQEDERRADSFAGTTETLTFAVSGLSKLVGLPQMKLAWIVVSGPADDCRNALQRLEVIADTYLSVATPVQHTVEKCLSDPLGVSAEILRRVRTNYQSLIELCASPSPVTLLRGEGGWNAVLRLPATRRDGEWSFELLREQNVLTHPGDLFDFDYGSCLVVSLLQDPGIFREGIHRLLAFVRR